MEDRMIVRILCIVLLGFVLSVNGEGGYFINPKPDVFVIGGDVGQSGQDYSPLINRLINAPRGTHITIIVERNIGGWMSVADHIRKAIRRSSAIVITESRGWTNSAALEIIFAGDYVVMPKDNFVHVAHLKFIGTDSWPIRFWYSMPAELDRVSFMRRFFTMKEWNDYINGENVHLHGPIICAVAQKKIVDDATHCVIDNRGN